MNLRDDACMLFGSEGAKLFNVRSRYVLPLELLIFSQLAITGMVGGPFGEGPLNLAVRSIGEGLWWPLLLTVIGIVGLSIATIEWLCGRTWSNERVARCVIMRKWLTFAACFGWLYVCYVLLLGSSVRFALLYQAMVYFVFSSWAWMVNFRTAYVLSPRTLTTELGAKIEKHRLGW